MGVGQCEKCWGTVWLVLGIALLLTLSGCSSGGGTVTYQLEIQINPSDGGIVERNPEKLRYATGSSVELTAIPSQGWQFSHWDGDASGSELQVTIPMTNHRHIIAVFVTTTETPEHIVTFSVLAGDGNLTATADGDVIQSGSAIEEGTEVVFAAEPATGYEVKEWVINGTVQNAGSLTYTVPALSFAVEVQVRFEPIAGKFAGGTGTSEDPFLIATAAHLNNVRNYLDGYFRVIAPLELSSYGEGEGWLPIGGPILIQAFSGTFDGGDFYISDLWINRAQTDKMGLFGFVQNATIHNVVLKDAQIVGGNDVGSLVGHAITSSFSTCSVEGDSSIQGTQRVGGLIGFMGGGTVPGSSVAGTVKGKAYVGGFIGSHQYGTITYSRSTASVTTVHEPAYIGGFVGYNFEAVINDCLATGTLDLTSVLEPKQVGGFVGWTYGNTALVERCYAEGDVLGNTLGAGYGSEGFGGFAGYAGGTIRQCYASGEVLAWEKAGGFAGVGVGLIEDCSASGKTNATSRYSGGFVGIHSMGDIRRCLSTGLVPAGSYRGGFFGSKNSSATITNSYFDKETAAGYLAEQNQLARSTSQLQVGTPGEYIKPDGTVDLAESAVNLMYPKWDTSIWNFGTTSDYPQPQ